MRDVERIAEGVKNGEIDSMPLEAYIYNIAKYSYSLLAVFDGVPDALAITGGVVKCDYVRERLLAKLKGIRVPSFPGRIRDGKPCRRSAQSNTGDRRGPGILR
jgi:butyrate kinase